MRLLCSAHEGVSPFLRKTVQEQPSSRGGCSLSRRFRPALQRLSCRGRGRPQAGAVETPGAAHPAPLGAHGHQRGLHRDPEGGSAWPAVPAHPPPPRLPCQLLASTWAGLAAPPGAAVLPPAGPSLPPPRGPLCSSCGPGGPAGLPSPHPVCAVPLPLRAPLWVSSPCLHELSGPRLHTPSSPGPSCAVCS